MGDNTKSKRNSNMELLRILAMLMIIAYHIFIHCVDYQLTDFTNDNSTWQYFANPVFIKKLLILSSVSPMGQIGNGIFVLITGYFMANKGKDLDLAKTSKKLLIQMGFASILLTVMSMTYSFISQSHQAKILNFNMFNEMAWFIGYYFTVIVLAKIFLNDWISKWNQKNYLMFIMIIFTMTQIGWCYSLIRSLGSELEILLGGVFWYALGGYIRKYNPFDRLRTWIIIAVIIVSNIMIWVNFYNITVNNIREYIPENGEIFKQIIPKYGNSSIIVICITVAVFELFRRMAIKTSRVINFLGASTFMVYLIHDNQFFYNVWNNLDWLAILHNNPGLYIIKNIYWVIIMFALGVASYTTYILIGKLFKVIKPIMIK